MNMQEKSYTSEQFGYGVLSYLSVLCLIPILAKKEDDFIKFHAKQGLMLFIIEIAAGIIGVIPLFGGLVMTLGVLVCGLLSLAAYSTSGRKVSLPVPLATVLIPRT
jgi:fumarate reductase subunit D